MLLFLKPIKFTDLLLSSQEENLVFAHEQLSKIVGRVDVTRKDGSSTHGSCFLFSSSFHMLTCAHVVSDALNLTVVLQGIPIPATIVYSDEKLDIALINLDEGAVGSHHSLPCLKLAPQVTPGMSVFVGGYRTDSLFQVTAGSISNSDDIHAIKCDDCISDNGTSGGPAVGRFYGNLLGMVRGAFGTTQISTSLIPPWDIEHFFSIDGRFPNGPSIEVYKYC